MLPSVYCARLGKTIYIANDMANRTTDTKADTCTTQYLSAMMMTLLCGRGKGEVRPTHIHVPSGGLTIPLESQTTTKLTGE